MATDEQNVMRHSGGTLEYKDAERTNTVKIQLIMFQKGTRTVSGTMMEKIRVMEKSFILPYILRMCVILNTGVIG